ncbi:Centrosomal protein of [Dirofilaria immitis]
MDSCLDGRRNFDSILLSIMMDRRRRRESLSGCTKSLPFSTPFFFFFNKQIFRPFSLHSNTCDDNVDRYFDPKKRMKY